MNDRKDGIPDTIPWQESLATRLTWAAILIVTVALIITGFGLIQIAYTAEQESVFELQKCRADEVALLVSSFSTTAKDEVQLFEEITPLSEMTPAEQRTALENLLVSRQTLFSQIALLDPQGVESVKVSRFHTYLPGEMGNLAGTPAFLAAINGSPFISPVYVSPDSGLLSSQIAIPVRTPQGGITGVLITEVNVVRLWQEISRTRIGDTGYAYLVDGNGRFIAYQESSEVLQNYGKDMRALPPVADFIAGSPVRSRQVYEYRGLTGQDVIGVYSPIAGTGWAVVAELPTSEAYASITRMRLYLASLIFICIVICGSLVFVVSRRIVQPIQALTLTARRMGAGDLDAEVVETARRDEVGVLARTFSHMQAELKGVYKGLEQQVGELRVAHETLLKKNEELNAAYQRLSAAEENLRQNYADLKEKESQLQFTNTILLTQQETSLNGILVVDDKGRIVTCNQRFIDLWDIPETIIASKSDRQALDSVLAKLEDPGEFQAKVNYLYEHRSEKSFDEIQLKNAKIIERYSSPMIGPDGTYFGRVWYFLDITARKAAEKELREKTGELRGAYEHLAVAEEELRHNYEALEKSQNALSQARNKLNVLNTVTFQDIQNAIFSLQGYLELESAHAKEEGVERYTEKQRRIIANITASLRFASQFQNLGLNPPRWQNVAQTFLYGISHLDISRFSRSLNVEGLEIYADPLLETVFFTLAENVITHGGTATTISLYFRESPGGITIFFEDNGQGIPADMKEKMFDRQYEEKKDMGLFLAREILSVTGISIRETGEQGSGARFEISVPKEGYRISR